MIAAVVLAIFSVLMLLGVPLAFSIGAAAFVGVYMLEPHGAAVAAMQIFESLQSFPLVAIPMFLLMANLMGVGGVTNALVRFATSLVGHVRGSLAIGNVVASTLFAGISGSCLADTTAVGSMMIPVMIREGYPPAFAGAVTAAANIVGPIIPPSILMILYAFSAELPVIKLFLAGILPGLVLSLVFGAYAFWVSYKNGYGSIEHKFRWINAAKALLSALPALVIPAVIIAGVLGGVFTVSESAGIAALYALVYAIFRGVLQGKVPWGEISIAFRRTATDTGVVMFLLGTSGLLGWVMTRSQAPQQVVALMGGFDPMTTLMLINVFLLVLGLFMEPAPALLICTSLLLPLVKSLGIDPIHFGIIMIVNLQLAVLTPPVAISAVVTAKIAGISVDAQTRALWPYIALGIVALGLITYIPAISLWIPNAVGR
jgi:tripartite ATP-independent transporter DctM subunit